MAKTPQGSYECANMGYGEPKFKFLLCWTCPNGSEPTKPRWYPIHIRHPNPLASKNDDKVWTQEFDIFWCNIWHKPKLGTFLPLFCLQVKFYISITYLTIILDTTIFCFVIPPLHHDGIWWVVEWNTCRIHYH
jgi:hypothetical protein